MLCLRQRISRAHVGILRVGAQIPRQPGQRGVARLHQQLIAVGILNGHIFAEGVAIDHAVLGFHLAIDRRIQKVRRAHRRPHAAQLAIGQRRHVQVVDFAPAQRMRDHPFGHARRHLRRGGIVLAVEDAQRRRQRGNAGHGRLGGRAHSARIDARAAEVRAVVDARDHQLHVRDEIQSQPRAVRGRSAGGIGGFRAGQVDPLRRDGLAQRDGMAGGAALPVGRADADAMAAGSEGLRQRPNARRVNSVVVDQ